jgi:hypothetical protein
VCFPPSLTHRSVSEIQVCIVQGARAVVAGGKRVLLIAREDEVDAHDVVAAVGELRAAVVADDRVQQECIVADDFGFVGDTGGARKGEYRWRRQGDGDLVQE